MRQQEKANAKRDPGNRSTPVCKHLRRSCCRRSQACRRSSINPGSRQSSTQVCGQDTSGHTHGPGCHYCTSLQHRAQTAPRVLTNPIGCEFRLTPFSSAQQKEKHEHIQANAVGQSRQGRLPPLAVSPMKSSNPSPLTHAQVKELIDYDPASGHLTWKVKVSSKTVVGKRAGWSKACKGKPYLRYRFLGLLGRTYAEHRLIWFWLHGAWPRSQVDHLNGNGEDNRQSNLREAEPFENSQNVVRRKPPASGVPGVFWHAKAGKWESKITYRGGTTYLGLFASVEEASKAYLHAKSVIHTFNPDPRKIKTDGKNNQTATRG